jgi:hypothetical protein
MNPTNDKDLVEIPSQADKDLINLFNQLRRESLNALERTARQIITLVSALISVFFGILAFSDEAEFLSLPGVKVTGILALGCLLAALFSGLGGLFPSHFTLETGELTGMKTALDRMLRTKHNALNLSLITFGCGVTFLFILVLIIFFQG